MKQKNFTLQQLPEAADFFIQNMGSGKVFLFDGEMGAGKTTFISEICRLMGADDDFGSPTFSLVNEYADSQGNPIYHFDLYRVESPLEIADMGAEEYFDSGELCFVEWPDRLGPLEPEDAVKVEIKVNPDDSRTLLIYGDSEA